jgi:hypothetical protein
MHASCTKTKKGMVRAGMSQRRRKRQREGRRRSLSTWQWGAGHGSASVVLKEEKWTEGLGSVWGADESEEER